VLHSAAGEPPGSGPVLVAVRPSAISLHTEQPRHASPRNVWPGTVAGVELLTDRVRVEVNGSPPALVDVTPDAVAELDLAAGSPVWLSAKATEIDCYPDPR
jgi:molybdate transport system ATP-binding protein